MGEDTEEQWLYEIARQGELINTCAQVLMRDTHGVSQERCDALALVLVMRCRQDGIDPGILLENTLIRFWEIKTGAGGDDDA